MFVWLCGMGMGVTLFTVLGTCSCLYVEIDSQTNPKECLLWLRKYGDTTISEKLETIARKTDSQIRCQQ